MFFSVGSVVGSVDYGCVDVHDSELRELCNTGRKTEGVSEVGG